MGRESAPEKARRLLTDGRLIVRRVDVSGPKQGLIVAECRGDGGSVYRLGYDPIAEEWRCQCEARSECSHLMALKLVCVTQ